MRNIDACLRAFSGALSAGLAALVLPVIASAGCGSYNPGIATHVSPRVAIAQEEEPLAGGSGGRWHHNGVDPIVGMWKTVFTATDGSGYTDFGYSQWHSDGTEMLNSGSRAPATQNYCLGVWEKTDERTYQLNHFALSYDATTGDLNGKVNIREDVKVSAEGFSYSGSFVILIYDPTGKMVVAHISGTITGTRVTVDTTTP